ncbi:hypothetical protein GCM10028791_24700 [Echinicola sediminis]
MKFLSYFFFYTYVGLVTFAGFWGAFVYPALDFKLLFSLDVYQQLDGFAKTNLLSQYRFLRALELGFGIFSLYFVHSIFTLKPFNYLFLLIMGLGILARIFSWIFDGNPSLLTKFFMFYEAAGWICIAIYSTPKLKAYVHQTS